MIYVSTKESLHDIRMIFQYMLSHGYMKYEIADKLNCLLRELISTNERGNKKGVWKETISKAKKRKMRTIDFKNSHISFTDFRSYTLN